MRWSRSVVSTQDCKQWILRRLLNSLGCLGRLGLGREADAHAEESLELGRRIGMRGDLGELVACAMAPAEICDQCCEICVMYLCVLYRGLVCRCLAQVCLQTFRVCNTCDRWRYHL